MKQLIIIRGNSGSGKTTLAKKLREKIKQELNIEKVAVIGQDAIRRKMLEEVGPDKTWDNVELIEVNAKFCIENNYVTIIEGILKSEQYKEMLERLIAFAPNSSTYYLDVSFDETLKRHETKREDIKAAFGKQEMERWFVEKDYLGFKNERIIPESLTEEESLDVIFNDL